MLLTRGAHCMYVLHFFAHEQAYLFRPPVFSRALGCFGTNGGRVYSTVQVWAPAGLRGACSGRSKLRELALFHGIAFRDASTPSRRGPWEPLIFSYFALVLLDHTVPPAPKLCTLRQRRYNSSRTSSFPLCDGHGRCFYVCTCVP